jgi:hypothetical protein
MSASSQSGCYRKVPNVRIRGVPEMGMCLAYTPSNPEMYTLSLEAWLILQLCDGRSEGKVVDAYYADVEPLLDRTEAAQQVRTCIEHLLGKGIVEFVGTPRRKRARA